MPCQVVVVHVSPLVFFKGLGHWLDPGLLVACRRQDGACVPRCLHQGIVVHSEVIDCRSSSCTCIDGSMAQRGKDGGLWHVCMKLPECTLFTIQKHMIYRCVRQACKQYSVRHCRMHSEYKYSLRHCRMHTGHIVCILSLQLSCVSLRQTHTIWQWHRIGAVAALHCL